MSCANTARKHDMSIFARPQPALHSLWDVEALRFPQLVRLQALGSVSLQGSWSSNQGEGSSAVKALHFGLLQ